MNLPVVGQAAPVPQAALAALADSIEGSVRFSRHDRLLYSTDASMYQVQPLGVVIPRTVADVSITLAWCRKHGLPVLPRGGGTSLSGQTVNEAVVIDLSADLRGIGEVDVQRRCVHVEPGAVLDAVQEAAGRHGLLFGPEVSTSTHATLGGMISNRSAGLHSLHWGMTDAHVIGVDVVLADGGQVYLGRGGSEDPRVQEMSARVAEVVESVADEIDDRYEPLRRNVGGYALDRVLADLRSHGDRRRLDLSALMAGSEGTLGLIVGADLNLEAVPGATAMAVAAFPSVARALEALPAILGTDPASVELLDHTVLDAAEAHEHYRKLVALLPRLDGERPGAVLYVDWFADTPVDAESRRAAMETALAPGTVRCCDDLTVRQNLWKLRKVGLGLILTGDEVGQPVGGLEDCAVPPDRLAAFQSEFDAMLASHGLKATYYAHASVGLLHIRPRIDLSQADGRQLLEVLGREATALARKHGGTVSGEHGDGRVRAAMMHEYYGPVLVDAFRRIKAIFDPDGVFNPGIITTDPGMTSHLRRKPGAEVDTWFRWEPSLAGAAAACNGNAYCRRTTGGAMCPSYRATLDERHSTRGRANTLRAMLDGAAVDWSNADTLATLDLCLGCKACRSECPAEVDMATLKSEYLAHAYAAAGGPPAGTRIKSSVRGMYRVGAALHPVSTLLIRHGPVAWLTKRLLGIAPSRVLPGFGRSLRRWHERRAQVDEDRPVVLLYPDCFTTWSEPEVGKDAIGLLEAFGYRVVMPRTGCCGRTLLSAGRLDRAAEVISASARALLEAIRDTDAVAVLAVEPSCATALQQEWADLRTSVPIGDMKGIAAMSDTVVGFLAAHLEEHPQQPVFTPQERSVPIHEHCHQKHRAELTLTFLQACGWPNTHLVDTGCCGMAGAWGYEASHDTLSRKIARQSLKGLEGHSGAVAACGTSCRHQMEDVLDLKGRHPVTLAREALVDTGG
ncbi:MAG: FAD-linked oxidase C-terminal domain-containing protein [Phycisphaerales bacterium]|jgi:FAD/FMN-containing dehydrogenase/Fe-S oxidoreductase|nr:FAD-linked oxidase C-terminal domain-containing protein [Phycisphaerales bacterium]